ncbi:hypothetical protein M2175_004202 [Bradyrhizobium elkanii]|uniref:hypothetical protein n=1 Tax=Bradyrhizobium TaxID=374 RepID=UPI0012FD428E|nr:MULTISPECIES: hypothetical protein [Bradyrhizobium]MCS3929171.1 hypothetical protein [Bradyrhizobium elkanii]MCS3969727.1 hypothetical protein [Bradyrhizobium japonicum]
MPKKTIACSQFTTIFTNPSANEVSLSLDVNRPCGGDTVYGLYDMVTDELQSSSVLESGTIVPVPAKQYLAVRCDGSDHAGEGCEVEYGVV